MAIQNNVPMSILLSIKQKYCELIANGKKTIEIRKTCPKIETPFKCYIYETKAINRNSIIVDLDGDMPTTYSRGRGKVIGEFTCDKIEKIKIFENGNIQNWNFHGLEKTCLSYEQIATYIGVNKTGYAWYIKDLKLYKIPNDITYYKQCHKCEYFELCNQAELSCSGEHTIHRPPQSWCYVRTM